MVLYGAMLLYFIGVFVDTLSSSFGQEAEHESLHSTSIKDAVFLDGTQENKARIQKVGGWYSSCLNLAELEKKSHAHCKCFDWRLNQED